jgi:hypothetical protein
MKNSDAARGDAEPGDLLGRNRQYFGNAPCYRRVRKRLFRDST